MFFLFRLFRRKPSTIESVHRSIADNLRKQFDRLPYASHFHAGYAAYYQITDIWLGPWGYEKKSEAVAWRSGYLCAQLEKGGFPKKLQG